MITPMKKILLAGKISDKEKVLEVLRNSAVVHVDPVDPSTVIVPEGISKELMSCKRALSIIEQFASGENQKDKIPAPGTPSRIMEEIIAHDEAIPKLEEQISILNQELEKISPWGELGLKDIEELEQTGVKFYFLKGAESSIKSLDGLLVNVCRNESGICWAVGATKEEFDVPSDLTVIDKPLREDTEIISEISVLKRKIEEHKNDLNSLALRREDLENFQKKLFNEKQYSEVETGAHHEEGIFVLQGFCPESEQKVLEAAFEEASLSVGIQLEEPSEEDIPPTKLENSSFAASVKPLYDFMGLTPSYNEPDTSWLFMLMLAIFSSFLLADAGYGLLVLVAVALAYKPLADKGFDKRALNLALCLFGGVSAYGIITNTYFGARLIEVNSFNADTPEGMKFLQGICFLMGAVHLTVAHVMKVMRRKIDIKVLSEIGWVIFVWGMYGIICKLIIGKGFVMPEEWVGPFFQVSLFLILVFTNPSWNIFKSILSGLGAIAQNASACFSDIVSYIRLWAVGLAGGKVAGAFNNIAEMIPSTMFMVPGIFFKVPVLVAGHAINIILGVIAILAHGVRLNLLEFSNHLELDWSGREYDPYKEIK